MSSDLKFWVVRLGLFAAILFDTWLMFKMAGEAFEDGERLVLWGVIFFGATILTIPLGFWAYVLKRKRWEQAKPMDRVEVEALAAYSKQAYREKHQTKKQ
jgi:hypothetical protein